MVSCEMSCPRLELRSQSAGSEGGGVHRPPSQAPCLIGQLSHQFCRSSPHLCSFGSRVVTHLLDCCFLRLAVCVEFCDRFMAQGKSVYHLINYDYHHDWVVHSTQGRSQESGHPYTKKQWCARVGVLGRQRPQ